LAGVRSSNKYLTSFKRNSWLGQLGLGKLVSLFPAALTSTPTTQTTLKINYGRIPLFFDFESVNQPMINTIRKTLNIDS
jgi:hypothetical protein